MIILGIESTAHTFGIGIIKASQNACQILTNCKDSYSSSDIGMIPGDIAIHHKKVATDVLKRALSEAKLSWEQIDSIAYSAGPGLDPALWAGFNFAKDLANKQNKQLIPVNHCTAHLSIGKIINHAKDPVYLYVSGVNTQVIVQQGVKNKNKQGKYKILGETLDLGMGNMLDKFARTLKLGFPGGPKIEKIAKLGSFIKLPYTVKGMDVNFSGLLTKCTQLFERKQASTKDLCFSLQEHAFAMTIEIAERAMAGCNKNELILVGGVGANKRFCEMLNTMCKERNATFYNVPIDLAGDQGAMIAWEGFLRKDNHPEMEVNCKWRTDEV